MKDSWRRLTHKLSRGRLAGLQVWCSTAHMLQAGRSVADCRWAHATRPIFGRIGRVCTDWVCSGPDVLTASSWCNGQPCRLRSVAICLPPAPGNDHLSFRDVCATRERKGGKESKSCHPSLRVPAPPSTAFRRRHHAYWHTRRPNTLGAPNVRCSSLHPFRAGRPLQAKTGGGKLSGRCLWKEMSTGGSPHLDIIAERPSQTTSARAASARDRQDCAGAG